MRGIFVEAMEQLGKQLDIKIDWSYETTWATFMQDLRQHKFDAACTAVWMLTAAELTQGEFTTPLYYSQIGAWVHEGNKRFDNNFAALNDPATVIAGIDGSYALDLAKRKFPAARVFSSTSTAEYITGLMNVAYGKADVTFVENWLASGFVQKNPGMLRQVPLPDFLDTRPNVMMVRKGELELQSLLNNALLNLQLTGAMENILTKYEITPGNFKRVKY
jgi:ABC-type amino acid transport substrate-binding protein